HTYTEEGVYTVTLTVTFQGCTATATGTVTVASGFEGPSAVEVPNVFTPNGDGVNDQFAVSAAGIERIEVRIFNRYGEELARLERAPGLGRPHIRGHARQRRHVLLCARGHRL
ncbi:MAG: gliding motility-associated C-terminal domain-containing protein, partial [Flavobacteriales bacterium]